MIFLDANIFIRLVDQADPAKSAACYKLFQKIKEGKVIATTSESVLAEVAYWLSGRNKQGYGLSSDEVAGRVKPLLGLQGFYLESKQTCINALDIYAANPFLDLEDALSIAHMQRLKIKTITSYDTDFDRLPTITRQEP